MARPAETARGAGTVGMGAVLLGGAGVLVALAVLDWYDYARADSVGSVTFANLRDGVGRLDLPGVVPAYFDWLAWALLIALIIVGMLANAPTRATNLLRASGLVLGLAGAGLTYYAVYEVKSYSHLSVWESADAGLWCALAGFVVAGIGAAIGPRRD